MKTKLYMIIISSLIYCQFPIELNINESYSDTITLDEDGEYLLDIISSSNTSWEEGDNESSTLSIYLDGYYNQDIILYNGSENHTYKQAVGFLEQGEESCCCISSPSPRITAKLKPLSGIMISTSISTTSASRTTSKNRRSS